MSSLPSYTPGDWLFGVWTRIQNIPAKKLVKLVLKLKNAGGAPAGITFRCNNDTGNNYNLHNVSGASDGWVTGWPYLLITGSLPAGKTQVITLLFSTSNDSGIQPVEIIGGPNYGGAGQLYDWGEYLSATPINEVSFSQSVTHDYEYELYYAKE